MASINVTVFDVNGNEEQKNVPQGTKLGDFLGTGQQGLIDGQIQSADTVLRESDDVEIITRSGKAGCEYTCLDDMFDEDVELVLEPGDVVIFNLKGNKYRYEVHTGHLSYGLPGDIAKPNDAILRDLGLTPKAFTRIFYTRDDSRKGEFPEFASMETATRIVKAIFLACDARNMENHILTIDGVDREISHESFQALKDLFSK